MAKAENQDGRMRVAVVDDDTDTRIWLKDVLQSEKRFNFAGGFSSAAEALATIPRLRPDMVLVDIKLPDMGGIECARRLRQLMIRIKVVTVSGNRETEWFDRAFEAGAVAYLIKPFDPAQLIATLRFVAGPMNKAFRIPAEKSRTRSTSILNPREQCVLSKLAEGLLYKEISDVLGISYAAVHKCQHSIFKKLQVSNRSEALRAWLKTGGK
jgi:DNA-binding NarL/FixJ family response regulator